LLNAYKDANVTLTGVHDIKIARGSFVEDITTLDGVCGFIIPIKGKALYKINKSKYQLTSSSILHAGPGMPLSKYVGDEDWRYILIHYQVEGDNKNKSIIESTDKRVILTLHQQERVRSLTSEILNLYNQSTNIHNITLKIKLLEVIDLFVKASIQKPIKTEEEKIEFCKTYIKTHLECVIPINDLSNLVSLVFMAILKHIKFKELIYVPLLGLMISSLVSSLTTFIAYKYNFLQVLQGWFYGSFSLVTSGRYELIYLIIIPVVLAFIYAKAFTIVSVGENFATNLGLNYERITQIGVFLTAIISACIVVVVGSVPFLGLVVPNIVTLYAGDNLEKNILDVVFLGVVILLACDLISRYVIYPYELPIAMVVGVLGTGFFLMILFRKGGKNV